MSVIAEYLLQVPYKAQSLSDILSLLPLNGPWPSLTINQFWASLKCSNIPCKQRRSELLLQSCWNPTSPSAPPLTQSSYQGKAGFLCQSCTEIQPPWEAVKAGVAQDTVQGQHKIRDPSATVHTPGWGGKAPHLLSHTTTQAHPASPAPGLGRLCPGLTYLTCSAKSMGSFSVRLPVWAVPRKCQQIPYLGQRWRQGTQSTAERKAKALTMNTFGVGTWNQVHSPAFFPDSRNASAGGNVACGFGVSQAFGAQHCGRILCSSNPPLSPVMT